jgi:hypothetical protein
VPPRSCDREVTPLQCEVTREVMVKPCEVTPAEREVTARRVAAKVAVTSAACNYAGSRPKPGSHRSPCIAVSGPFSRPSSAAHVPRSF